MGKRVSTDEPMFDRDQPYTTSTADVHSKLLSLRDSPPSPHPSDTQHDPVIEIQFGDLSHAPNSVLFMPGEDGPLVPGPPIIDLLDHRNSAEIHRQRLSAPVSSDSRSRNVGRTLAGATYAFPLDRAHPHQPSRTDIASKTDDVVHGRSKELGFAPALTTGTRKSAPHHHPDRIPQQRDRRQKNEDEWLEKGTNIGHARKFIEDAHAENKLINPPFTRLALSPSNPTCKLEIKATITSNDASRDPASVIQVKPAVSTTVIDCDLMSAFDLQEENNTIWRVVEPQSPAADMLAPGLIGVQGNKVKFPPTSWDQLISESLPLGIS